jgi:signal transduction histidine kinase
MLLLLKKRFIKERARINPLILGNIADLQNEPMTSILGAGISSLAILPLRSPNGTIGFVCLLSQKPDHFKTNATSLLRSLGNRVAVAIERARLYEKVQAGAVLEERERISAELHDGLAQVLGYVITKSQATRQLLRKITAAHDHLVELENVAQEVYTDTREAILGLRTAISGDRNMVSALREYATRFNQMHSIKTELIIGDNIIPALPPHVELQAIRIVQEALSNIRKHANATKATIKISAECNEVIVVVEDDGKGFDYNGIGDRDFTRFGLKNMKERADSIHSQFSVESGVGNGTKVILRIPLIFSEAALVDGGE